MKMTMQKARSAFSDAEKWLRKAESASPTMKKELTLRSRYYARQGDREPCGETFFRFGCECGILRLLLILFLIAAAMAVFGMLFCRRRK